MRVWKKWTALTMAGLLAVSGPAFPRMQVSALGAAVPGEEIVIPGAEAVDDGTALDAEQLPENEEAAVTEGDLGETALPEPELEGSDSEEAAPADVDQAERDSAEGSDREEGVSDDIGGEGQGAAEDPAAASNDSDLLPEAGQDRAVEAEASGAADGQPEADAESGAEADPLPAEDPGEGQEFPAGEVITARRDSERYVSPSGGADNDDLFAAYVNRELELTGDLMADTGDVVSTPRADSNYAYNSLSGYGRTIYGILLEQIRKVAAGERTDTEFTVTLKDLGLEGKAWTAAEIGLPSLFEGGEVTQETLDALDVYNGFTYDNFSLIYDCLLADCPFDLYWHDKTEGTYFPYLGYSVDYENGQPVVSYTEDLVFSFIVSSDYSESGETGTFAVDASIGNTVQTARNKAQAIVQKYAGKSDYEKLDGYRKEICDLVSYNDDAAENYDTLYGNPWQLLWVFDGDPATNVVCEGYSKSFQYLCDLSSFNSIFRECISVTGDIGGRHMWNIVSLRDGRSYLVDITNCDSGSIGEENGNPGRKLFLIGTGTNTETVTYAQGSPHEGYYFGGDLNIFYQYDQGDDQDMFSHFDEEILTLAAGQVDASTTAGGGSSGHSHIYIPGLEEKASTCTEQGHSAGSYCIDCGEYGPDVTIYPLADHTPGAWKVTTAPTYDRAGTESTNCTYCGKVMTRSVAKLVSETSISLNEQEVSLVKDSTCQLTATVKPANAADRTVTWSSDKPAVAKVSSSGKVTALSAGTAVITAKTKYKGLTASCRVTVTEETKEVTAIELDETLFALPVGSTWTITATLTPEDAADQEIQWTSSDESLVSVDQNGTVKARKYGDVTITATTSNGLSAECEVIALFKDVANPGKSYFIPVYWAVESGITVCTVNFRPDDSVTRGEFVAFLWRLAGKPKSSAKTSFKDVNTKTKFYDAIRWAVGAGIIKGYSDKTFRPDNNVTRGETATMIWRFAGKPAAKSSRNPFSDLTPSGADSYKAILWGAENGIIKGSGGKFLKSNGCTRGQVVTFLYRYVDYLYPEE